MMLCNAAERQFKYETPTKVLNFAQYKFYFKIDPLL